MKRLALVALLLLPACTRDVDVPRDGATTQAAALVAGDALPSQQTSPSAPAVPPSSGPAAEVLDERDGRVLRGVAVPPPPDSDAMLRYHVSTTSNGDAVEMPEDLLLVDNALLLPGDGWVAVLPSTELVVADAEGVRVLDTEVARSLDLTADARHAVYMRGHMPMFEIHEVNLETGERVTLTQGFAPAWLPAYSSDGARVMFTSARSGFPAIYSVARDGSDLRQHTNNDVTIVQGQPSRELTPSPTGPRAPLWGAGLFVFESDTGVIALREDGRVAWTRDGASAPRWQTRGEQVVVGSRGAPGVLTVVDVSTGEPAGAP